MSEPITLEVGMQAPTFTALDSNGATHTSDEYIEKGRSVIVYFYPRDSTPGCTKQACDFRDNMARLISEGYEVLGVSKDSEKSHQKFITKQDLNFPLLLDTEGTLHDQFGTWRMKKNYGREYMGCVRSTFVINPEGIISWCRYNVRAKGHVEMLLRELSLQE
jgi:peroxiredoxin Q/BCP